MLKRISLDAITRNPDQPRQHFDQRGLEDLAASISENGLKQPITVRPIEPDAEGHRFMVVMGERRFRAHLILAERGEVSDILCHVRRMDEKTMHIDAILENLQRAEVSPIEEAKAYHRALTEFGFTVPELAKKLGMSQSWRIPYRVKLLGLSEDNRALAEKGVISWTQAYHMAGLSPQGQTEFLSLCKRGLANNDQAAASAAAAIEAKEAQAEMPMVTEMPKRKSITPLSEKLDKLGADLMPLFKDGPFQVDGRVDPDQAQKCAEKIRLLCRHLGQMERELLRAASVSAAA
jgi:ParB family chromosome partitioning protein